MVPDATPWWRDATVYQVYPRSFQDSDGDGVGDLEGIRRRLPYLAWLGVDAVWLSPIYTSPMADFGYDISDHCDVDPLFGTLADFDRLVAEAHSLGLKLLLDYVPNHTSDRHPWFEDARAGGAHRDWYLWRDGTAERPPNNWLSSFGGPAWTWDEQAGAWYYHAYLAEQPDLNWRNPEVRSAMAGVARFWLERGADGFRIDALRQAMKDDQWRDNPPNPDWRQGDDPYHALLQEFSADRPEVAEVVAVLRDAAEAAHAADGRERLLIGELYLPVERLMAYYGYGIDLPFNFHLLQTPWRAADVGALVETYEAALPDGAWPNWVLSNHDRPRVATRVGPGQARAAAVLLLTLRGTPTLYYGDELGMPDADIAPEQVQDPWGLRDPAHGRDRARTPMPWDDSPHAGFCDAGARPWLPLSDDAATRHVARQREDPDSILMLHRDLLALRRAEPALTAGAYRTVALEGDVLAYLRGERVLVALNLGEAPGEVRLPGLSATVALGTARGRAGQRIAGGAVLGGGEALVARLDHS
jgi:alpha-glucosidase